MLKDAIKERKQNKFGHIDADELDLWKVSDSGRQATYSMCSDTFSAPESPFRE